MVVVAYNRKVLLRAALKAMVGQSRPADRIHVIDNASTDGTSTMVREEFRTVDLHMLPVNTGGAGGFAAGIAVAAAAGAELVWLMDDDTVPSETALAELLRARSESADGPPALVASRVVWTDGRDHPMNTPRERPGVECRGASRRQVVGCSPCGRPLSFRCWCRWMRFGTWACRRPTSSSGTTTSSSRPGCCVDVGAVLPGQRRRAPDPNLRLDRCRSGRALLLRGAQQGVDVYAERRAVGRREGALRRLDVRRWARTFAASATAAVLRSGLAAGFATGYGRAHGTPVEVLAAPGCRSPTRSIRAGSLQ